MENTAFPDVEKDMLEAADLAKTASSTGEETLDDFDEDEGSIFSDLDDDIDVEAAHEVLSTNYEVLVEAAAPTPNTPPEIEDGEGEGNALSGETETASSLISDTDQLNTSAASPNTSMAERASEKSTPSSGANVQAKATPSRETSPSKPNLDPTPPPKTPPIAPQTNAPTADAVELSPSNDTPINTEGPLAIQPTSVGVPSANNQPAAVWEDGMLPASSFPVGGTEGMGGAGGMGNAPSGAGETAPSQAQPPSTWEEGMEGLGDYEGLSPKPGSQANLPDDLDVQIDTSLDDLEKFCLEEELSLDEGVDLDTPLAFASNESADNVVDLAPYLVSAAPSPVEVPQDKSQSGHVDSASSQSTSSDSSETLEKRVLAPAPPAPDEELDALTRQMLLTTPQRVVVELGALELRGEEIMELGYGSVLRLNRRVGQMVDITLNGWRLAKGEVVLINERDLGVRMVSVYSNPPKQSP